MASRRLQPMFPATVSSDAPIMHQPCAILTSGQCRYLRILFPLIVIGASVLLLCAQNVRRAVRKNRSQHAPLSTSNSPAALQHTNVPPSEHQASDSDDDDALSITG